MSNPTDSTIQNLTVTGSGTVAVSLRVGQMVHAQSVRADQFINKNGDNIKDGYFVGDNEARLEGQGLRWETPSQNTVLAYRQGNRLWTNTHIDLEAEKSFRIDNIDVLSATELGSSITKSNLNKIGVLNSLDVAGAANIGYFAFFNSEDGRLGLGTDTPNAVLSLIENDVELIVGANTKRVATIGTYTNHDLAIVTDNIPRIIAKKNGEVHIGNENFHNAVLKVHGTIEADLIITDNRIDRSSPLEFTANHNGTIYGLGLTWKGTGITRQLIMMSDPDRLWSSENFELQDGKSFYINGQEVLSSNSLGGHITESSLVKIGTLRELSVQGEAKVRGQLIAKDITGSSITFNDGSSSLTINENTIEVSKSLSVSVQGIEELYVDTKEIVFGNKFNTSRPVKVFGPFSVGVNNPDPTVSMAVSGNISFADKKFIVGTEAPIAGTFKTGDICWNTSPTLDGYVGWRCIVGGSPGEWAPCGALGRQ
jgi:hypothetical protein